MLAAPFSGGLSAYITILLASTTGAVTAYISMNSISESFYILRISSYLLSKLNNKNKFSLDFNNKIIEII
jgi:hypothetical protein